MAPDRSLRGLPRTRPSLVRTSSDTRADQTPCVPRCTIRGGRCTENGPQLDPEPKTAPQKPHAPQQSLLCAQMPGCSFPSLVSFFPWFVSVCRVFVVFVFC